MSNHTASTKRYLTAMTQPGTHDSDSEYHWVDLPGGGVVIVMLDGGREPHPSWTELPHLFENTTAAAFDGIQPVLGAALTTAQSALSPIAGVAPTDNTFKVAKKLAKINRHFHP